MEKDVLAVSLGSMPGSATIFPGSTVILVVLVDQVVDLQEDILEDLLEDQDAHILMYSLPATSILVAAAGKLTTVKKHANAE